MTEWHEKPEVVTDATTDIYLYTDYFYLACDPSRPLVIYESLFRSTRVTGTLSLGTVGVTDCTLTVTVERQDQPDITFTILPDADIRGVSLTVDCLKRIYLTCSGGSSGNSCIGEYNIEIHWCKSC
ncbi:MAG: S-Ena type endospore appendage [Bacillota bacterium]